MMKLIMNGEPYVFKHTCPPQDKGKPMNNEEKRIMGTLANFRGIM